MANFLHHDACDKCNSVDNKAVYDDGSTYCFGCSAVSGHPKDNAVTRHQLIPTSVKQYLTVNEEYIPLTKRGITKETTEKFKVKTGYLRDEPVYIFSHYGTSGTIIGQKVNYVNEKKFKWINKNKQDIPLLFGQELWEATDKLFLVITEGHIDAMSVYQAMGRRCAVVSIADGAQSAYKTLSHHINWLNKWKHVVLGFDNDEVGHAAMDKCVPLFDHGKVRKCIWKYKDANDAILNDDAQSIVDNIYAAGEQEITGLVTGSNIDWDTLMVPTPRGAPICYPGLDACLRGLHKQRITLVSGYTGRGKSTFCKEIGYNLYKQGYKIANIFLEEGQKDTICSYVAIENNVPLFRVMENTSTYINDVTKKKFTDDIAFFDHFGSIAQTKIIDIIKGIAAKGYDFIILDHVSILISGLESSREGERKDIDIFMTNLRSIVQKTGIGILLVCHINKGSKVVDLDALKGAGTLSSVPDAVVGLNPCTECKENLKIEGALLPKCPKIDVEVFKNRVTGERDTVTDHLVYDFNTGRLKSI